MEGRAPPRPGMRSVMSVLALAERGPPGMFGRSGALKVRGIHGRHANRRLSLAQTDNLNTGSALVSVHERSEPLRRWCGSGHVLDNRSSDCLVGVGPLIDAHRHTQIPSEASTGSRASLSQSWGLAARCAVHHAPGCVP